MAFGKREVLGMADARRASSVLRTLLLIPSLADTIPGFSISSAFSKFGFELILISAIQRRLGHRPWLFLLAFMTLAWTLSMFISNVVCCLDKLPPLRNAFGEVLLCV